MVDLTDLLGGNPGGLLTPEQASNVNQNFLQSIAAGMMKASGPSPYKGGMRAFSDLGEALQGGLAARRAAQQDAVTQTLARAKMLEGVLPLLQQQQLYSEQGFALPPNQQKLLDNLMHLVGGGLAPRAGATASAAPGAAPGLPPALGPRAEAGTDTETTGGVPTAAAIESSTGYKADFVNNLVKELHLHPLSPLQGHKDHEILMDAAKRRAVDTDIVHQRVIQEGKFQDQAVAEVTKRVRQLKDIGQPITDDVLEPLRVAGVDEKIIRRIKTGGEPPVAKPVTTVPAGAAGIAAGIGTPPAPAPAGGLPLAPTVDIPKPPSAAGPPGAGAAPASPLRTGAAPSFLPPPAGAMPPTAKPPAPAPAVAPSVTPPAAAPVAPPAVPSPKLDGKPETPPEAAVRMGFPPEAAAQGHTLNPQFMKAVEAETSLRDEITKKREQARLDAENAEKKSLWDKKVANSDKLWTSLDSGAATANSILNNNKLVRDVVGMPGFNSGHFVGPGNEFVQNVKQLLGMDPNAAFAHDVFNKAVAGSTLAQLKELKDESERLGGGGKVLLQEYNTIQKAANSVGVGPASNIFLTRLSDGLAKQNIALRDAAVEYIQNNPKGILDEGFSKVAQEVINKNPAYKHEDLIAAQREGLVKDYNIKASKERTPFEVPTYSQDFKPPPGAVHMPPGSKYGGPLGAWMIETSPGKHGFVKPEEGI